MPERSTGTIFVWVLAAAVAALALLRLTGGDGHAAGSRVRVDHARASTEGGSAGRSSAGGDRADLFVHVAGAVRRPGLVRVPPGARVATAVRRAGGPGSRADLTGVNLAARVEDGQQVVVPVVGAVPAAGPAGAGASGTGVAAGGGAAGGVKLGLGTVTADQLDELDGIGPTLAERIIEYRTAHGGFGSIGELREVEGIGEKRFEALREALQP